MARGIANSKMLLSLIAKNPINREREAKRRIPANRKILKKSIKRITKSKRKANRKKLVINNLLGLT
jgi:hypothetical protein